jgi:hypothetical protein
MLGVYYYPWYRKPDYPILGGGDWGAGYIDHPVLGEYNSRDFSVISQHLVWVEEAGIDFLAFEWVGPEVWNDIALRDYYLSVSKDSKIKFCIHYDSSLALNRYRSDPVRFSYNFDEKYSADKTKGQKFLEDFEYLADTYFNHPQYLKINNRPVVIIYSVSDFRNVSKYFEQLKIDMAKRNISLFLVADVVRWAGVRLSKKNLAFLWQTPPQETFKVFSRVMRRFYFKNLEEDVFLSKYFDGIAGYNMYSANRTSDFLKNVDKVYQKFYNYARSHNLCFIPTVIPGYDDRNLSGLNRPILERKEGKFYEDFWAIAKKYLDPKLKMVLITTFNEWHEGTEIEPSKEYGNKYLELTKLLKN